MSAVRGAGGATVNGSSQSVQQRADRQFQAASLFARVDALPRPAFMVCCAALLCAAAALRWTFAATTYLLPNSDQVMVGLMARHILAGEHPLFYWGQSYNGTLESYITAAVFRVFGESYAALHVAPVFFSLLFWLALVALANQLYGSTTALLTGLILVPAPALLLEYSVWPGYNYLETMAFGTLALVLAVHAAGRRRLWPVPTAAFFIGVSLWGQPLAITYLPALAAILGGPVVAAWKHGGQKRRLIGTALAAALTLLIGLGPAIDFNVRFPWATVSFLTSRPNHMRLTFLDQLHRLILQSAPIFTGLLPPTENPNLYQRFVDQHQAVYVLALLILAVALIIVLRRSALLWAWCRSLVTDRPAGEGALTILGITLLAAYLFSSWSTSTWSATDPRYLLPLYTLTPLLIRLLFSPAVTLRRLVLRSVICVTMIGGGLAAISSTPAVADARPLANYLEGLQRDVVLGDYWLVYRLAFASDERLTPIVTNPDLTLGLNRYAPYLHAGLQRGRKAVWVVPVDEATDQLLRTCLSSYKVPYTIRTVRLSGGLWAIFIAASDEAVCYRRT